MLVLILIFNTGLGRRGGWHHLSDRGPGDRRTLAGRHVPYATGSRLTPVYGEAPSWTGWYVRALLLGSGL